MVTTINPIIWIKDINNIFKQEWNKSSIGQKIALLIFFPFVCLILLIIYILIVPIEIINRLMKGF